MTSRKDIREIFHQIRSFSFYIGLHLFSSNKQALSVQMSIMTIMQKNVTLVGCVIFPFDNCEDNEK